MGKAVEIRPSKVTVELDGENYELVYNFNAFCAIEEKYGSIGAAMNALEHGSLTAYRVLLWAGLQEKHPGVFKEPRDVGRAMKLNAVQYSEAIAKALEAALPQVSGEAAEEKN
jgi:hypothetical protein